MKLMAHQEVALKKLRTRQNLALFYNMGSGKTLTLLKYIEEAKPKTCLVIAPRYVCNSWVMECEKWDVDFTFHNLSGCTPTKRLKLLNENKKVYFTTPDSLVWLKDHRDTFTLIIVDEASGFKNTNTVRWKTLNKFKYAQMVLLTGTPTPNGLHEIYPLVKLIAPDIWLGKSIFLNKFFVPITMRHIVVGYRPIDKYVKDLIYKDIKDYALVYEGRNYPKESIEIPIVMSPKDKKVYDTLQKDLILEYPDGVIPAEQVTRVLQLSRMLTSGHVYGLDSNCERKTYKLNSMKLEVLHGFLKESSNCIVWYDFIASKEAIIQMCKDKSLSYTLDDVDGWNAGKYHVFIAHPRSYGYGMNMQRGGHTMLWYDLTFSSEQYQQANARLARKGQDNKVLIYHMVVKNTIDDYVMRKLQNKIKTQEEFLRLWLKN